MDRRYDYIILGAGIYGMYAAMLLTGKGFRVAVLEYDSDCFERASYVNQARVHRGYHYPRSYSTAIKSANYFERFCKDFSFAINNTYKKIYGISENYSYTSSYQFKKFCVNANIPYTEVNVEDYFKSNLVEGAFEVEEYSFDATKIKKWFVEKLSERDSFNIFYSIRIAAIDIVGTKYVINAGDGQRFIGETVVNATYASINQILERFNLQKFEIKYEISEIILCKVNKPLENIGITLMDGPFFSIMPFGMDSLHSLTSVTFTHHKTCSNLLPKFNCQEKSLSCNIYTLENCNTCIEKPISSKNNMIKLAYKYLLENVHIEYIDSLFSIKPILVSSALSDSRPTIIKEHTVSPRLISVFSGKINTIYDLDEVLI